VTDPQPLLAALADPTRKAVYERLSAEGPASASRLAADMPVSRQAIAKHLSQLSSVGLVGSSQQGREVVYEARIEPLHEMTEWIDTVGSAWDARLGRLRKTFDQ
jgi:DNA-binding transcriptional ArsR family regulator